MSKVEWSPFLIVHLLRHIYNISLLFFSLSLSVYPFLFLFYLIFRFNSIFECSLHFLLVWFCVFVNAVSSLEKAFPPTHHKYNFCFSKTNQNAPKLLLNAPRMLSKCPQIFQNCSQNIRKFF